MGVLARWIRHSGGFSNKHLVPTLSNTSRKKTLISKSGFRPRVYFLAWAMVSSKHDTMSQEIDLLIVINLTNDKCDHLLK